MTDEQKQFARKVTDPDNTGKVTIDGFRKLVYHGVFSVHGNSA